MHRYRSDPILRQKLLISLPCLRQKTFLYDPDSFRFVYKISAIKHRCNKCRRLIVNLYTPIKASGPKRHPRRLIVKLYILLVPGWTRNDHQVRDETWTILAPPSLGPGSAVEERGKKRSEIAEKSLSEASQSGRFGRVKGPLSSRLASFANFSGLCRFFFSPSPQHPPPPHPLAPRGAWSQAILHQAREGSLALTCPSVLGQ